jgi:hypothetical protein
VKTLEMMNKLREAEAKLRELSMKFEVSNEAFTD